MMYSLHVTSNCLFITYCRDQYVECMLKCVFYFMVLTNPNRSTITYKHLAFISIDNIVVIVRHNLTVCHYFS